MLLFGLASVTAGVVVAWLPVSDPVRGKCGYAALPSEGHDYRQAADPCTELLQKNRVLATGLIVVGLALVVAASLMAARWYSAFGIAFAVAFATLTWVSLYRYR
jgi:hypothetical protein